MQRTLAKILRLAGPVNTGIGLFAAILTIFVTYLQFAPQNSLVQNGLLIANLPSISGQSPQPRTAFTFVLNNESQESFSRPLELRCDCALVSASNVPAAVAASSTIHLMMQSESPLKLTGRAPGVWQVADFYLPGNSSTLLTVIAAGDRPDLRISEPRVEPFFGERARDMVLGLAFLIVMVFAGWNSIRVAIVRDAHGEIEGRLRENQLASDAALTELKTRIMDLEAGQNPELIRATQQDVAKARLETLRVPEAKRQRRGKIPSMFQEVQRVGDDLYFARHKSGISLGTGKKESA